METDEYGSLFRTLPDGRILGLIKLTFGRLRLTIGFDQQNYEDGW